MKNYKFIQILILLFFTLGLQGQKLKLNKIKRLNDLGIEYQQQNFKNSAYRIDIKEILKKERKRKRNKFFGYVFTGIGIISTTVGIITLSRKSNNNNDFYNEDGAFKDIVGGFFVASGVIDMGLSIPLFISSKKRRKDRDKLILELNQNFSK